MPKINLPETLDSLDDEPKIYHSLYIKGDDGKYHYKDPQAAIEGMRRAKEERTAIQEELTALKAQYKDVDPAKYQELLKIEKDFKEIDQSNRGEIDRIKLDLKNTYEGRIDQLTQRISQGDQRYANRILSGDLKTTLAAAGATDKGAELLLKTLKADIQIKMDDTGEPEFVIIDPSTKKPRLNANADPYTLGDLVADAKKEFPSLFNSNAGSGSGAGQGGKDVAPPQNEQPSTWSEAQKKAFIKANGHNAYRNLLTKEANAKGGTKAA